MPLDPFSTQETTGKQTICHAHAPCYVVLFWLFRLETAAVQKQVLFHFHLKHSHPLSEFEVFEFIFHKHSKLFSKTSKFIHVLHKLVEKYHAAPENMQTQFGRKNEVWFVVVDKHHAHPGKINSSKTSTFTCKCEACNKFQTHQMLTSTNFISHILFAFTCKVQTWPKTHRSQMLIHHSAANLQLCTNKPFPAPKGIHKRKRSTCSP